MQDHSLRSRSNGAGESHPGATADRQLIVVSNRQPYRHTESDRGVTVDRPTGGLTAGLDPAIRRLGGTWIAWGDGDADHVAVDETDRVAVPPEDPEYTLRRVWLSDDDVDGYYYGFSNQVLWPLCHSLLGKVRNDGDFWRTYRRVNEQFADAVVAEAGDRPVVWFQDYHLGLAPSIVRSRLPDDPRLMHFWHIPWPAWDTFRSCPHGRELLDGLLGNDVLGFHVLRYRQNFLGCVEAAIDDAVVDWDSGRVHHRGRTTTVEPIRMGIPVQEVQSMATSPTARTFSATFRADHDIDGDTRIALGVDRIDYTKGIPERIDALERLWESNHHWRGRLTYVQNASISRAEIPEYQAIRERVSETIDRINDRFGTDDWQPIVATTDTLSRAELCGLYRDADVALVSAIRDGLNLVAQEYVTAQTADPGVLVLSTGAGIHDVLGEHALSINPFDADDFATAIEEALTMAPGERRRRMNALRRAVAEGDLTSWLDRFLDAARPQQPVSHTV